ncbi:hypothetical protein PanWU01x14_095450 [Parasponia andersonii]|uniref:Uncharacterized protein n=1 Tax=Parasponia andersonii TaxID=3476 RepID=A0A2P5D510_PARAD|nr:hypothetical protein PanWU01x14_095450 [Parasponia andersonii]
MPNKADTRHMNDKDTNITRSGLKILVYELHIRNLDQDLPISAGFYSGWTAFAVPPISKHKSAALPNCFKDFEIDYKNKHYERRRKMALVRTWIPVAEGDFDFRRQQTRILGSKDFDSRRLKMKLHSALSSKLDSHSLLPWFELIQLTTKAKDHNVFFGLKASVSSPY